MRLCTLVRVIATFSLAFLASQILGLTIPQRPLSQHSNDPKTGISILQSKLTSRIAEHNAIMTAHFQDVSSTLANISSFVGESTFIFSDYKHQLSNLQESDISAFLNDLFNYLKVIDGELKQDVGNGLDSISQTLTLMIRESDEMDLFLSEVLEEMNGLERELINGASHMETENSNEAKSAHDIYSGGPA
jgi:hypothetical protein